MEGIRIVSTREELLDAIQKGENYRYAQGCTIMVHEPRYQPSTWPDFARALEELKFIESALLKNLRNGR